MHSAPFGRHIRIPFLDRIIPKLLIDKYRGLFSIQSNNSTRIFEYPWAFFSMPSKNNQTILEIGGGLSGFQFVLDKSGHQVVNVDPGLEAKGVGFPCTEESVAYLNRCFNTNVTLINKTIDQANLKNNNFDCAFSISVIEHLPLEDRVNVMRNVYRSLRPGGIFIITVDLFPELFPFTDRLENMWGSNINIMDLAKIAPFELVEGVTSELFGFADFNAEHILNCREVYLCGKYPAFAQCFILRKPVEI